MRLSIRCCRIDLIGVDVMSVGVGARHGQKNSFFLKLLPENALRKMAGEAKRFGILLAISESRSGEKPGKILR
jgi:hypothetical protein